MLKALERWTQLYPAHPWMEYAREIAAMVLAAWFFRALVIGQLRRLSQRTRTLLDDELVCGKP